MNVNSNLAKIAVNKSICKEYSNNDYQRIVYLDDNQNFQIQLFNPKNYTIGIDINIDNKSIGNKLILRPGERIWLERFINTNNKFLFKTYEVDDDNDVKKAIRDNGVVEIKFYKEIEINPNITWTYYPYYYNYTADMNKNKNTVYNYNYDNKLSEISVNYNSSITTANLSSVNTINTSGCSDNKPKIKKLTSEPNFITTSCCIDKNFISTDSSINDLANFSSKIETGRVEKGEKSNQDFNYVNKDFEYWPFKTEYIKILPTSQKIFSKNDLEKIYCTNCGRKLKSKYKFCPYCGERID